jgi:hypothetical protein
MASTALLAAAIQDAQKERLVIVLKALVQRCRAAIPVIEEQLLTNDFESDAETEDSEENEESEEEEPDAPPAHILKRKRALSQTAAGPQKRKLYEICEQCNEEYNVNENNKDSCCWHPGMLFVLLIIFVNILRQPRSGLRIGFLGRS